MRRAHVCSAANHISIARTAAYLSCKKSLLRIGGLKGKAMFLNQVFHLFRVWRRYNVSVRELSQLGDHELADIGISRSQIASVAWKNAQR
jgi:uncharacterized protein YjiS (DUF1127 family)